MIEITSSYIPARDSKNWYTEDMQYYAMFNCYDMGGRAMYTVEIYRRADEDNNRKLVVVDSAVKYTPAEIKRYAQRTLMTLAAV